MAEQGKPQDIVARTLATGSVPSLSPLAVRLVELAADDNADVSSLAGIIEQDPGLTARLLRLVNSPALRRGPDQIASISRAVVLLGLREVRIMALSLSLRDTLPLKKGGEDYKLFWRASLHRAVLARETARLLGMEEAEEAFAAGLLLEMGLPLMLWVLEPEEREGFPGMDTSLARQVQWERESLGVDHRQVGRALMEHWGLPQALVSCQEPEGAPKPGGGPGLAQVTDFARLATEAFFLPECPLTDIYEAGRGLGLGDEEVNQVLAGSLGLAGDTAQALELDMNQDSDLLAVMEKANAALGRLSRAMEPAVKHAAAPEAGGERQDKQVREAAVKETLEAVAHEIRNPLMSVGGFARRLAAQMQADGRARRYAEVIVAEAARLDAVLSEMVAVSEPFVPRCGPVDLADLVRDAMAGVVQDPPSYLGGRPPRMEPHLPGRPAPLSADRKGMIAGIRQALGLGAALLQPAEAALGVHAALAGVNAVVTVFGPGSPRLAQDQLSNKQFGPELALARGRRVAEGHGGYLALGSAPRDAGFVITFSVPVAGPVT